AFFFSSRRRHTRFSRDWSSDVCSSDLAAPAPRRPGGDPDPLAQRHGGGIVLREEPAVGGTVVAPDGDRALQRVAWGIGGLDHVRSEERRVGKERRARWGTEQNDEKLCG